MNKKYIFILLLLLSNYSYSQVGINTKDPKAMLHVNGSFQLTKELVAGGTATTAGNAGVAGELLTSQGVGLPPTWQKAGDIGIPQVTNMAAKTTTGNFGANTSAVVQYNTSIKNDNAYLTYSSTTGVYTVVKAGYYVLTGYLEYVISTTPSDGSAITRFRKNGTPIIAYTSGYPVSANLIDHSLTGLEYLNVGDKITMTGFYTRAYTLTNSSISFMYIGN